MTLAGVEALNVFGGTAYCDVAELATHRELDPKRFENLLMAQKSVVLPYEDPVTFAVNAAKPIVDALSPAERDRIEMLVTCTESGIDFGKSLSTYVHHYLGLNRNCRLFEVKNACYAGTAGFQTAINFVAAQSSPGAKALVIATDISRFMAVDVAEAQEAEWAYAEPSSGSGAVAMLIGENPVIFTPDRGAHGYYGYEVMDTCRPTPDSEMGDADLSLLSYLDCCEQAFGEYAKRVPQTNFRDTFDYLAFHTPFGGMVKGAHRTMMRRVARAKRDEIDADFERRVAPGLTYCRRVGNIMGGTVYLALAGTIDAADYRVPVRVGVFSYGSGCCSEFFSGVVNPGSREALGRMAIGTGLDQRYRLSMAEYDQILANSGQVRFGTRDAVLDVQAIVPRAVEVATAKGSLVLTRITAYHREYGFLNETLPAQGSRNP
ncbi:Hydroxymethylglutaryl-CoA synthase family protein [Sulfidibacter corallicola]|uniref:Hydroxymethylglutaryl-CoA synthase family protein n=1 Tax=Sulfidibacter corallicola TaxID=2818388 RepID=A0A8A4TFI2_SULCO|nr:hydroxymethylglutaryl-CoA synthase [Sulfidibacter corallicola]QTD48849.1 hydroxymethylglutaryl-CoA synthase family protein [Sulfidibacter corallicola]